MLAAGLAILLAAAPAVGGRLPGAPRQIYSVAWKRALVPVELGDWRQIEPGGPAVDPASGLVVVGTRDGWLHAFRPGGELAWEFQGSGSFGATPAIDAGTVYAGSSGGVLYALDLATGKLRWSYDAKEELGTRPAVAGGLVVIASLEDTVVAVDARTGAWRWHHRRERREGFTIRGAADVVVSGDTIFGGWSDGTVAALELGSGTPRWEKKLAPAGKYVDVDSLALSGGRLFAAAYSGAVLAVDPVSGNVLWQVALPDATRLASVGAAVVVVTTKAIEALSPDRGAVLWRTDLGAGSPTSAPVEAGRWLAVSTGVGGLQFIDPSTGKVVRVMDGGQGINGPLAASRGRGYVLANGGTFFALDLP